VPLSRQQRPTTTVLTFHDRTLLTSGRVLHYADNTKYRFDDESPEAQQVFDKHMENCPLVLTAYRESLSARFEHSESPVIKNSPYLPKEGMIRTPTPQEWEEIQLQWKRSTTISTHTR
jgi:hypothetical protein